MKGLESEWIGRGALGALVVGEAERRGDAVSVRFVPRDLWMPTTLFLAGPAVADRVVINGWIVLPASDPCDARGNPITPAEPEGGELLLRHRLMQPGDCLEIRLRTLAAGRFEALIFGVPWSARMLKARPCLCTACVRQIAGLPPEEGRAPCRID